MITNIEYCASEFKAYGIDNGERVEVVYDGSDFVLHPSVAWTRAEQALLQEQRDAQIAAERADALFSVVHDVLNTLIPRFDAGMYRCWVGTHALAKHIIRDLQDKGYIQ